MSGAIAVLAKAILELADKAAAEWDYDGEYGVGTGVNLGDGLRRELEQLAGLGGM